MEPEVKDLIRIAVNCHNVIAMAWGPNDLADRELTDVLLELGVKSVSITNEFEGRMVVVYD